MNLLSLTTLLLALTGFSHSVAVAQANDPLSGEKRIILKGNKGEQLDIGRVNFTPGAKGIHYTLTIDHDHFTD
ncbi:MAG: hypothetical protein SWN10_14385 [Pseudomonadota bacterium]|nr:hypothetical protein [Pseudomonadota bacterium]